MTTVVGHEILDLAIDQLEIDLAALIAACAFWAPQEPSAIIPVSPGTRRARSGEKRGTISVDGVRLDDNTYANKALKTALRHIGTFEGFAVCHVWAKTCYDARYHTLPANLVLLPRELSGLTDHNRHVEACLRYRAWELYKWHPENETRPEKPANYPSNWRIPVPPGARPQKSSVRPLKTARRKNSDREALAIDLIPEDPKTFRDAFIKAGMAMMTIHFSDGRIERRQWKCRRMSASSNVLGNLRSKSDFRNGTWQRLGISRVCVEIRNACPENVLPIDKPEL